MKRESKTICLGFLAHLDTSIDANGHGHADFAMTTLAKILEGKHAIATGIIVDIDPRIFADHGGKTGFLRSAARGGIDKTGNVRSASGCTKDHFFSG
jgi:hypothetical protein